MGQGNCCQAQPLYAQQINLFQMINNDEPEEAKASNQLKSKPQSVFISQRGYQNKVDGDFINNNPQILEVVFERLKTLHSFNIHDSKLLLRGEQQRGYFKFKKSGIIYAGEWKNGIPNGYGKNYYPDGSFYEGGFVDGIPHGYGRFIFNNGDYYQGQIKFGRQNGFGTIITENSEYKGNFYDDLKHGKGQEKGSNYYFSGQYEYGEKREGLEKDNGIVYEGQFENDKFNGKGKLTNKEGKYIGQFRDGLMHGNGQYKYKNGSVYKGNFYRGKRQGVGELKEKNGQISKGNWQNDELQGQGTHQNDKGQVRKCLWNNGKIASFS